MGGGVTLTAIQGRDYWASKWRGQIAPRATSVSSLPKQKFCPTSTDGLAYNLTRVMNIMGIHPLMAAIQT
jgi:hypothetical protein